MTGEPNDEAAVYAFLGIEPPDRVPPEERRLSRLRDWLERPNWNREESWKVLAGVDPELSPNTEHGSWWLLPGTSSGIHENEMADRLSRISQLSLKVVKPIDAVTAAIGGGIPIPWLAAAKSDPACRSVLASIFDKDAEAVVVPPLPTGDISHESLERLERQSRGASAAAKTRWAKDKGHYLTESAGRAAFETILASGFEGFRHEKGKFAGQIHKAEVFREVLKAVKAEAGENNAGSVQDDATIKGKVVDWITNSGAN